MPKKQSSGSASPRRLLWFAALLVGFTLLLYLYLQQPSLFAFQDRQGNPLNRFPDLFVMPQLATTVFDGASLWGFVDRIPLLLAAAGWLLSAGCTGWPLVKLAFVRLGLAGITDSPNPRLGVLLTLAMLAGLALQSTIILCFGLAGWIATPWPLAIGLLALAVAGSWAASRLDGRLLSGLRNKDHKSVDDPGALQPDNTGSRWMLSLIPAGCIALACFYLLGSAVPPWEFDVIEYHLQAPKEFAAAGSIGFNDHNIYANMPLASEMHSLASMVILGGEKGWWWGGLIGKLVIGGYSLLLALLVVEFLRPIVGRLTAWSVGGLTLAMVGNAHVAMSGLNDMALATFLFAMLVTTWYVWPRLSEVDGWSGGTGIFLASVFAGAAGACKYPGLLLAVLPLMGLIGVAIWRSGDLKKAVPWLVGFGLAMCVTCLPWLGKNAVATGNPVYPLAYGILGGTQLTEERAARWNQAHSPSDETGDGAYSVAAVFQSVKQLAIASPFVNPSLTFFGLVGIGVVLSSRRHWGWPLVWLGFMGWILALWWLFTHRIDRFWLPVLPLMGIMAALGIDWIARRVSTSLAASIALFGLVLGLLQILSGVGPVDARYFVPLAVIERETIQETSDGLANPATAWINRNLNATDKLLSIGEVKAYLYRVPILYGTCFDPVPGEAWLNGKSSAEQHAGFIRHGITHVMIDWYEIERYRGHGNYGFSDWPTHADVDAMIAANVLERTDAPFDPQDVEILRVVETPIQGDVSSGSPESPFAAD